MRLMSNRTFRYCDEYKGGCIDQETAMRPIVLAAIVASISAFSPAAAEAPSLTSDKAKYRLGDAPVFTVTTKQDYFLTLVAVSAENKGLVLYPNGFDREGWPLEGQIKGGATTVIPRSQAGF